MAYTVKQLASLAGVSPRTLRWYDQVGLLCPARLSNGYRRYGPAEVDRLQQILLFRAAGMELAAIGQALDDTGFDAEAALGAHLLALQARRAELDTLILTAEKTLKTLRGALTMTDAEKFEGLKQGLIDDNENKYGQEVRQRWGDKTADASNAKMMKMSERQYTEYQALGEALNAALAEAVAGGDATAPAARRAAELHRQWLCFTWPQYSAEAHRGLTQMYVDDERFAAHYEAIAPGAAAFLRDAVAHWLDDQA